MFQCCSLNKLNKNARNEKKTGEKNRGKQTME